MPVPLGTRWRVWAALLFSAMAHLGVLNLPVGPWHKEVSKDAPTPKVEALLISRPQKVDTPQQLGSEAPAVATVPARGRNVKAQETPSAGHGTSLPVTDYFAAEDLSQQPKPVSELIPVDIPWGKPEAGHATAVLYISASGFVDKVEIEPGSNIPRVFLQYLPQRFLSMRFEPGLIDQTPVSSRIRIEIEIDASN